MLASGRMVGFLVTTDYDKAREFYAKKLGFQFVSLDQFAMVLHTGENMIRIVKMPSFTPFQGTVLGWQTDDVKRVVLWLKERDVETEKYPFVEDKELGIWTAPSGDQVAWFKDPDGNVLSVSRNT